MNDKRLYIQIPADKKMAGCEKPRSEADASKEKSLILEIAHELGIREHSTRVNRKFSVVARGSCRSDSRFDAVRIDVDKIRLRSSSRGLKEQKQRNKGYRNAGFHKSYLRMMHHGIRSNHVVHALDELRVEFSFATALAVAYRSLITNNANPVPTLKAG
jgi:hypothetical protein